MKLLTRTKLAIAHVFLFFINRYLSFLNIEWEEVKSEFETSLHSKQTWAVLQKWKSWKGKQENTVDGLRDQL